MQSIQILSQRRMRHKARAVTAALTESSICKCALTEGCISKVQELKTRQVFQTRWHWAACSQVPARSVNVVPGTGANNPTSVQDKITTSHKKVIAPDGDVKEIRSWCEPSSVCLWDANEVTDDDLYFHGVHERKWAKSLQSHVRVPTTVFHLRK